MRVMCSTGGGRLPVPHGEPVPSSGAVSERQLVAEASALFRVKTDAGPCGDARNEPAAPATTLRWELDGEPRRTSMATYVLPDLRYDYGALEPHVSGRIMELHHDKHHAGYVKGANDTLEQLHEALQRNFDPVGPVIQLIPQLIHGLLEQMNM